MRDGTLGRSVSTCKPCFPLTPGTTRIDFGGRQRKLGTLAMSEEEITVRWSVAGQFTATKDTMAVVRNGL